MKNERYSIVEAMAVRQAIEVEPADRSGRGVYASAILTLAPTQLAIAPPVRGSEALALEPGATIRIVYQGQISKYAFETVVREVTGDGVVVDLPERVQIASRRAHRIALGSAPVLLVRLEHGAEEVRGSAVDVSVWGVRVILPRPLSQWERVRAVVTLPDGPMSVDAQIVRIEEQAPSEIAHGLYYPHLTSDELTRLRRLGG